MPDILESAIEYQTIDLGEMTVKVAPEYAYVDDNMFSPSQMRPPQMFHYGTKITEGWQVIERPNFTTFPGHDWMTEVYMTKEQVLELMTCLQDGFDQMYDHDTLCLHTMLPGGVRGQSPATAPACSPSRSGAITMRK